MGRLGQSRETIQSAIVSAALAAGVNPDLALAVADAESDFNQAAVSSAGAIGIFQLMPATAAWLGVNPYDWRDNIRGGVAFLAWLADRYAGDLAEMLAGYNWGPGNLADAQARYGAAWLNYAPAETRNYVANITAAVGDGSQVLTAGPSSPDVLPWLLLGTAAVLLLR